MQVVIALAGLRVSEAVGLLVHEVGNQVALDGSVDLTITPEEKHNTSYEHITPLPREGVADSLPFLQYGSNRPSLPTIFAFAFASVTAVWWVVDAVGRSMSRHDRPIPIPVADRPSLRPPCGAAVRQPL